MLMIKNEFDHDFLYGTDLYDSCTLVFLAPDFLVLEFFASSNWVVLNVQKGLYIVWGYVTTGNLNMDSNQQPFDQSFLFTRLLT